MNPYISQYYSKEWQNKRKVILKRDKNKCKRCGRTTNLQVHHKYYKKGRKVWNYPNRALITLCKTCHENEHKKKHNFYWFYIILAVLITYIILICNTIF